MPRYDPDDAKYRLVVDELDSVGLVAAGANGPADIMITKRLDEKPKPKTPWRRLVEIFRNDPESADGRVVDGDEDVVEWALAFAAGAEELEKARNVAQYFEANIHSDFTNRADSMFAEGYLTREERISLSSAIGAALSTFASEVEENAAELLERDPYAMPETGNDVALVLSGGSLGNATTTTGVPWSVSATSSTAQLGTRPTIEERTDRSDEKEAAEMPDTTLSDEVRADLDDTVKEYVERLEAELAEVTKDDDPPEDDVVKDASPEIQALLKAQAEELEKAKEAAAEANAVAKAERDARIEKEYVEKAAAFAQIAKAEDLAPIYRKTMTGEALELEEAEKLESWLREANEKIRLSKFYSELGSDGEVAEGSARATVESKAAELRKSDPSLTKEQAEARVLKADRSLATRFDQEERERVARTKGGA